MINDLLTGTLSGKVTNPICRVTGNMLRGAEIEGRNDGKPVDVA